MENDNLPCLDAKEWTIVCDFDGTITPFDVTDAVLEKFARPEWECLEKQWLQGEITARRCMERQIALIETPQRTLDDFLDGIPVTEGFMEFHRFCREREFTMLIISDGMDYAIKRVLARHRLAGIPVIANRLRYSSSGYRLEFPFGTEGCPSGVCKCSVAGASNDKTLLIGDGRSDCCLAGNASFTLAKRGKDLERHCKENGYPHAAFDDFYGVIELLTLSMCRSAPVRESVRNKQIDQTA